jgi:phosphoglycolate phosphatase
MTSDVTLLVDLDGTLTDNYPGISRSVVHALERLGHAPPGIDELRRCVGPPLRQSFARLLATRDAATLERAIVLYRERYADVGWRENMVYEGIADALPRVASIVTRMFVCTSKPQVFAQRIVDTFGLAPFFAAVYGAELGSALDDKAALVAHLAQRESVDLDAAIMVGDREHDVRAARVNGARAIGVLWGYGTREELAQADALAGAPADLMAAVTALRRPPRTRSAR